MADKNPIFDAIGASAASNPDGDDVVALVAYSLYKRDKREWADSIRAQHDRDPTEEENTHYFQALAIPSSLDRFKSSAEGMLVAFAAQVVEDEKSAIEENAISTRIETASGTIERSSGFWRQVGSSVIASTVTISILVTLTIAAQLFGIDIVDEAEIIRRMSD